MGDGLGDGLGDGWGAGLGAGLGDGWGDGLGDGWGDGLGDGWGSGLGASIKTFAGKPVNMIDNVPTVIDSIRGNVAKGAILNGDLTVSHCFVVKQNDMCAHGEDLHSAMEALRRKLFARLSVEERIEEFYKTFAWGVKYPNEEFFIWHNRLTGSCEMGRKAFAAEQGIDMSATSTVEEFIELTRNAYGGSVIKQLAERYKGG